MKTLKKRKRRPHLPPNKVREDKRRKKPRMAEAEFKEFLASLPTDTFEQFLKKLRTPPITHSMASDDCPYPELW